MTQADYDGSKSEPVRGGRAAVARLRNLAVCMGGVALTGFILGQLLFVSDVPQADHVDRDGAWAVAIAEPDTVFIAEMTSGEIAAAQEAGKTSVIVAAGGLEQNGPHVVAGKHDFVARRHAEDIARELGDALVAPVVSFTPQGGLKRPSGWIGYPGAVGVSEGVYRRLLEDIAESLRLSGFDEVIFIGDSGGDQAGMAAVARRLDRRWGEDARALYIADYYYTDQYSAELFTAAGLERRLDADTHSDPFYEAVLAEIDPALIRAEERLASIGAIEVGGVSWRSERDAAAFGRELVAYRVALTVEAIQRGRVEKTR